jgi:hypothetical protein
MISFISSPPNAKFRYYVFSRGNAGDSIFKNEKGKEEFLKFLEKAVDRYFLKINTYCLKLIIKM